MLAFGFFAPNVQRLPGEVLIALKLQMTFCPVSIGSTQLLHSATRVFGTGLSTVQFDTRRSQRIPATCLVDRNCHAVSRSIVTSAGRFEHQVRAAA